MRYSSKHGGESKPGAYDSVVLEGDAPVMSSGKKEQSVEDVRKHNEEYMKNQTNEEKNESKSYVSAHYYTYILNEISHLWIIKSKIRSLTFVLP